MNKSQFFGLAALILVSPKMSDNFRTTCAIFALVGMILCDLVLP